MTYMEHLQDNLRTYSPLVPLTDEENQFLLDTADLMQKYPTVPCNDCKYCMPCPYGIDIPGVLVHYNKCVNEGNMPKDRMDENYVKARRAFWWVTTAACRNSVRPVTVSVADNVIRTVRSPSTFRRNFTALMPTWNN